MAPILARWQSRVWSFLASDQTHSTILTTTTAMAETLRIHLLSGPRNISTALMYSFAQRADTTVVDEPLYAHYLKVTGLDHPGRDEVLAVQENDGQQVVDKEVMAGWPRPVVFFKHIAKQFIDIDPAFLLDGKVLFLIREPDQMLSSFIEQVPNPTLQETALKEQWELAEWLQAQGQRPLVLDSKTLSRCFCNPKRP